MSFDFRADQIRTGRVISSGSSPLLIYPSSSAADLQGGLTGFSTASVGADVFLFVSGSSTQRSVFGGDVRVSGSMTASIRTVDGTNNLIVGNSITANFNSLGQWELTGSSVVVGGSDTSVQFNQNGDLAGTSSFTYNSGTMGVMTLSGTNPNLTELQGFGTVLGLGIISDVEVSKSFVAFNGVGDSTGLGGPVLMNGATLYLFSASLDGSPAFAVEPAEEAGTALLALAGNANFYSGSLRVASPPTLAFAIHSGAIDASPSMTISQGTNPGELTMDITGAVTASRINAPQITGSLKTVDGTNLFIAGSGVTVNYNSLGQFELTGSASSQPTTLAAQQLGDAQRRRGPLAAYSTGTSHCYRAGTTALASVPKVGTTSSGVVFVYSTQAGAYSNPGYLASSAQGTTFGWYVFLEGGVTSHIKVATVGGGTTYYARLSNVVATTGWHAVAWSISTDGATVRYSVDGGASAAASLPVGSLGLGSPRAASTAVSILTDAASYGSGIPMSYMALWNATLADADLELLSANPSNSAPDLDAISGGAPAWEWAAAAFATGIATVRISGDTYSQVGSPQIWMP